MIYEVRKNLNEYINIYNAPFKDILSFENISYLKKRKLLRDSYLLISDTHSNSYFELLLENNSFYLKKKGVLIHEAELSDFNINSLINVIYKY